MIWGSTVQAILPVKPMVHLSHQRLENVKSALEKSRTSSRDQRPKPRPIGNPQPSVSPETTCCFRHGVWILQLSMPVIPQLNLWFTKWGFIWFSCCLNIRCYRLWKFMKFNYLFTFLRYLLVSVIRFGRPWIRRKAWNCMGAIMAHPLKQI